MPTCFMDHITITAPTLKTGADLVYRTLGITPQKGGEHPRMGTHNLFLRLGDSIFLEIIAINPKVEAPNRPRWFALDQIVEDTPAKLMTWVIRSDDIQATVANCKEPVGDIEPMSRGEVNWLITIPKDGSLPIQGGAPAVIQWQLGYHPANNFVDYGLSLAKLQIFHPEHERIIMQLKSMKLEADVEVLYGAETKLVAYIKTQQGIKKLSA